MHTTAERLRRAVDASLPRWLALTEEQAAEPLAPGKWSRKELLGHLIDSASNNLQRFVRAHFQSDLVFAGYAQDEWIRVQHYGERPLDELVTLWRALNAHIAHVIEHTPLEITERSRLEHNFHQIAWRRVPSGAPATLGYFHADYVGHLEHHLRQAWSGHPASA
ncbi:MAG: DinB family protein [Planctomycetes bacterium]|nr:DinB family protein [Planctomycetota bacterium]